MASSRVRSRKPAKDEICRLVIKPTPVKIISEEPLNLCLRDVTAVPAEGSRLLEQISRPADVQSRSPAEPFKIAVVTKRRKKRSTIFVPPEKLSNEVSICKFKFVAGNQPRLQEKKVLSLDSGGNFRFFPEAVEQLATNSKPVPDLLPIEGVLRTAQQHEESREESSSLSGPSQPELRAVRKTQKRQRIEDSFKDKGFLIQTQHVQATEGAVFCKFRQLKKFTRYLYRSWKQYLPDDRVLDT